MHYIFNHSCIVEVFLALPWMSEHALHFNHRTLYCGALPCVVLVLVAVLLGVCGEVMVHVLGKGAWVGWGQEVGHVIHSTNSSIKIDYEIIRPLAISTLGDFSLSQNGQPILVQSNFCTLNKSGQCSPKHKLFSFFVRVRYDRWMRPLAIHTYEFSPQMFPIFYLADHSKVSTFFFETLGMSVTFWPWRKIWFFVSFQAQHKADKQLYAIRR